jgi:hypothetical protein
MEEEDTETKLAILSSIFTGASPESLFDILISAEGSIERAIDLHLASAKPTSERPTKRARLNSDRTQGHNLDKKNGEDGGTGNSVGSMLKWTPSAEPARKVLPFRGH